MATLSEFLVKVGVDADTNKVQKFEISVKSATTALLAMGVAAKGLILGLGMFAKQNLESLDVLRNLADETNESTLALQQLGTIAELNGSSAEALNSTISSLSRTIGEAVSGIGKGATAFENYGLSAKDANGNIKTASVMLEEIRAKMEGLSSQEKISMIQKLGIDPSMLQMLSLTNEEMEEARKNVDFLTMGTATEENTQKAAEFNNAMGELGLMLKSIGQLIALYIAPHVVELINQFKLWFIANQDLVKDGLAGLVNTVMKVLSFLSNFVGALDNVISNTIGWKNAIIAVSIAWAILNRKMIKSLMTNPVLLMITAIMAAIVGLMALIDDLITYMQGGESYLGEAWQPVVDVLHAIGEWWDEAKPTFIKFFNETIALIGRWVGYFKQYINGFVSLFKGCWNIIVGIFTLNGEKIKTGFAQVFQGIKNVLTSAGEWFKDVFNYIILLWNTVLELFGLPTIGEIFTNIGDSIKSAFAKAFQWVIDKWNAVKKGFADLLSYIGIDIGSDVKVDLNDISKSIETAQAQARSVPASAISNSSTDKSINNSNNKISINTTVNATGNPNDIARQVANANGRMLTNTLSPQRA